MEFDILVSFQEGTLINGYFKNYLNFSNKISIKSLPTESSPEILICRTPRCIIIIFIWRRDFVLLHIPLWCVDEEKMPLIYLLFSFLLQSLSGPPNASECLPKRATKHIKKEETGDFLPSQLSAVCLWLISCRWGMDKWRYEGEERSVLELEKRLEKKN